MKQIQILQLPTWSGGIFLYCLVYIQESVLLLLYKKKSRKKY